MSGHKPVLMTETIDLLAPASGGRYLDGTFGGGGHSRAILAASGPDGRVLALDADPDAIARAESLRNDQSIGSRITFVHANFADLAEIAKANGFVPVDGVLLDLGLSSFQLDQADRGFAFRFDAPLDMRFDPTTGVPASELVNLASEAELATLIFEYGEEQKSRRIAKGIVRERSKAPISSTAELARVVSEAVGGRRGADTHPATRTFQALRIATNREFEALELALAGAVEILKPGARMAVISFHSLEDRIVKRFMQRESANCICPPDQPICTCDHQARLIRVTRQAVKPSAAEIADNPRSRSAVLRVGERLPEPAGRGDAR
ncbi:MAG: 16S rRNA (cytosine(1402)-N(4))-methyltransferase RsmH [Thermomicrobiales bacterium]